MQIQKDDPKLAYALRAEDSAEAHVRALAAIADAAERRTVGRAWVCWAVVAFTPGIGFAFITVRRRRLANGAQPGAAPNSQ